jgi:glutamine amidotransferase
MIDSEIVIIDYGVGNLLSVQRGLEFCGAKVIISSDPDLILHANKIVLPGVGAFSNAMQAIIDRGLLSVIKKIPEKKIPLLGICLGMQMLMDESEEFGLTKGLGLIPGRVIPIPNKTIHGEYQKIPNVGWYSLNSSNSDASWNNSILRYTNKDDAVYFVHSFMSVPINVDHKLAYCEYGGHEISAVIQKDNIIGCQFHPEKSGQVGLNILKAFLEL